MRKKGEQEGNEKKGGKEKCEKKGGKGGGEREKKGKKREIGKKGENYHCTLPDMFFHIVGKRQKENNQHYHDYPLKMIKPVLCITKINKRFD